MITNAHKINNKYLSLCPPDCLAAPKWLPCSHICTRRPCSSTARLFCQGAVMHMLHTMRNKTHDTEALVHACSAWARRGSKNTDMLFWKDVGNRILLDRPLPFKLHQAYRRYVFYSRVARNIVGSAKNTAVMTVMTSTPRSASHYRGNAVIITALSVFIFI